MPIIGGSTGLKSWRGEYSFAVDAGAEGTLTLRTNDGPIPAGSYIMTGIIEVDTAVTGVGASVAVQANGANDIVSAAAISGAPWSSTGRKSTIPVGTGAASVKCTADRQPAIVISGADLTAGIFRVILFYR